MAFGQCVQPGQKSFDHLEVSAADGRRQSLCVWRKNTVLSKNPNIIFKNDRCHLLAGNRALSIFMQFKCLHKMHVILKACV